MKIRVSDFRVIASEIHKHDGTRTVVEKLIVKDTEGRLHERFSNDPPGVWHEVDLPERARPHTKRPTATTGKRASKLR